MRREQFVKITRETRAFVQRGAWAWFLLKAPTYVCAAIYGLALAWMALTRDGRIVRFALVPAATFTWATLLRRTIDRPRPYDALRFEPVGAAQRGKGRSLPSRHTASAAAIAFAMVYAYPGRGMAALMTALCALVALSRVARGVHYPSDIAAALVLAAACAAVGFGMR
jgi:phosphatidylglycerophosphatase B